MDDPMFEYRDWQIFSLFWNVQTGSGAHPASYLMSTGDSFTGQSARGVILNTRIHLVSMLRMPGVVLPLPLHGFMDWKVTDLLYSSMCHTGLELMKYRQLIICEKLIWSCLSSISIDIPEKQRQFSVNAVIWQTFWRDSIATTKWPLFNILKAKHLSERQETINTLSYEARSTCFPSSNWRHKLHHIATCQCT
jgi:hypothetical protein